MYRFMGEDLTKFYPDLTSKQEAADKLIKKYQEQVTAAQKIQTALETPANATTATEPAPVPIFQQPLFLAGIGILGIVTGYFVAKKMRVL